MHKDSKHVHSTCKFEAPFGLTRSTLLFLFSISEIFEPRLSLYVENDKYLGITTAAVCQVSNLPI